MRLNLRLLPYPLSRTIPTFRVQYRLYYHFISPAVVLIKVPLPTIYSEHLSCSTRKIPYKKTGRYSITVLLLYSSNINIIGILPSVIFLSSSGQIWGQDSPQVVSTRVPLAFALIPLFGRIARQTHGPLRWCHLESDIGTEDEYDMLYHTISDSVKWKKILFMSQANRFEVSQQCGSSVDTNHP